jgi:hypothetical protein
VPTDLSNPMGGFIQNPPHAMYKENSLVDLCYWWVPPIGGYLMNLSYQVPIGG